MNNLKIPLGTKINSRIGLINNFINYLQKKNIEHCFLGDVEKSLLGQESDLDFYINISQNKLIIKLVQDFCEKNHLKVINLIQHEFNSFQFSICYENILKNIEIVYLDLANEYVSKNRRIIKFKPENISKLKYNDELDLKVLNAESALVFYLLKKILKLKIDDQDLNYILKLSKNINDLEKTDLKNYFNEKLLKEVIAALKNEDVVFFKQRINFLNSEIIKRLPIKLRDSFKIVKRYIYRFFNPTGIFMIILGCDGVGKTSLIKQLSKTSKMSPSLFFRQYKYFHFAPFFKYQSKTGKVVQPTKEPPYNFIISFIKIIYLYFVFLFGYYFTTKLLLLRTNGVIIDRYFYDILVDPNRYRIKLSKKIIKFFSIIVPRPEITFIITANYKLIYERKKEIKLDQINEIQNKYVNLKKFIKNSYLIDNSEDLHVSEKNMKNIMINYLNTKFEKIKI